MTAITIEFSQRNQPLTTIDWPLNQRPTDAQLLQITEQATTTVGPRERVTIGELSKRSKMAGVKMCVKRGTQVLSSRRVVYRGNSIRITN